MQLYVSLGVNGDDVADEEPVLFTDGGLVPDKYKRKNG